MSNLTKIYPWIFNASTENNYEQEDLKGEISSWINDSVNFFNGKGHFSHSIKNDKLISGTRTKIGHQNYMIGQILNNGNNLGDIYIFKENPALDRIHNIYGTIFNNLGVHLRYLNYTDVYNGPSFIETLYGTGKDGDLDVTNTLQINTYSYLIGSFYGTNYVDVQSSVGFNVGDEVLLIQTQYSDNIRAGQYEFQIIENIDGNRIYFRSILANLFYDSTVRNVFNAYNKCAQLIKVPHYENVTVTNTGKLVPKSWDGYTGGILVFRVKNKLINDGLIDGRFRGFRGGYRSVGEGIFGKIYNPNPNTGDNGSVGYVSYGGGGGYNPSLNCPGAGGGYATSGQGSHISVSGLGSSIHAYAVGGSSILNNKLSLLSLGTGGGGVRSGATGGNGAACALICSSIIENNGSILFDGQTPSCSAGSGSGGGIILYSEELYQYGKISCLGGPESCSPSGAKYNSSAGAGANGRLVISSNLTKHNSKTLYYYGTYFVPTTIEDFVRIGKLPTTLTVPIFKPYFVKNVQSTKINITEIQRLDKIEVIRTFPTVLLGSYIKLAISFNDGKSWISWYDSKWNVITIEDIDRFGMSVDLLDTMSSYHYLKPGAYTRDCKYISFAMVIQSGDKFDSPKVTKINIIGSERSWRPFGIKTPRVINTVNIGKVYKFMSQT